MVAPLPVPSSSEVSRRMSRQRRRDTAPEMSIRQLLHAQGYRYRVAWPIPGLRRRTIDIAFTAARMAIFIDGCFWHSCPQHKTNPAANSDWWSNKLETNRWRDSETNAHLEALGWSVLRIWEHESPADAVACIVNRLSERRAARPYAASRDASRPPVLD
ncbi:very short patch repair endonuclease [Micromonospora sp. WMMD967]|uniref:very short patch repair endonuclease n=1 Tax=Micromonospora sp. WMMD967 TaxID=3016101 RepID=UPI002416A990|nr:very short patch repair endonuclease [Micromonospora sp. WMMD967]MDG4836936.1 very short patch repair endonuclease [Micromonospora sp. WMMD967]